MSDSVKFSRIETPETIGTSCWTCTEGSRPPGQVGGFFRVNFPLLPLRYDAGARPAMCRNCVYELGRVAGMRDPHAAELQDGVINELSETLESLQGQLAAEKINKYVPLADVVDFFDERSKRRPEEPVPVTAPKVSA